MRNLFFLLTLTCLLPGYTQAQKVTPIKVLIVDGFSNHDWKQTTAVTKWILEESGRFQVEQFQLGTFMERGSLPAGLPLRGLPDDGDPRG